MLFRSGAPWGPPGRDRVPARTPDDALAGETVDDVDQFGETFGVLVLALGEAVRHALLDVELEDDMADARDCRLRGSQLLQNRDAGSRLLDHLANAAELPFDPLQTRQHVTLVIVIQRVRARTVRGVDYSMRLGRGRTSPVVTHSLLTYATRGGNVYLEPGSPSGDRRQRARACSWKFWPSVSMMTTAGNATIWSR